MSYLNIFLRIKTPTSQLTTITSSDSHFNKSNLLYTRSFQILPLNLITDSENKIVHHIKLHGLEKNIQRNFSSFDLLRVFITNGIQEIQRMYH